MAVVTVVDVVGVVVVDVVVVVVVVDVVVAAMIFAAASPQAPSEGDEYQCSLSNKIDE